MAFMIGIRMAYVTCKHTVGILTAGEFKKLADQKINILRKK